MIEGNHKVRLAKHKIQNLFIYLSTISRNYLVRRSDELLLSVCMSCVFASGNKF